MLRFAKLLNGRKERQQKGRIKNGLALSDMDYVSILEKKNT